MVGQAPAFAVRRLWYSSHHLPHGVSNVVGDVMSVFGPQYSARAPGNIGYDIDGGVSSDSR